MLFFVGSLWSSSSIHSKMMKQILKAPISFFDKNPIGRILNRFTKDMNSMDNRLPISMLMVFNQAVHVIGVICVVLFVTRGRFIPILLVVMIIYFMLQRLYLLTQRELSRLTSNSRSPILALVSETCTGASTIRAYKAQQMYFFEGQRRMNTNAKVMFAMIFTNRWLALRLEIIGGLVVFFTAILALMPSASPKFAGLSISYALTFTFMLYKLCKLVRNFTTIC
jgi:ATP-binding cassette subfamily C (CFTR/MRP) protein 1